MKLYYFTEAHWALQALRFQCLKVSNFSELNDPFELLSPIGIDKVKRSIFKRNKARLAEVFRLICFSDKFLSPVMWSHYSSRHKGIVLEFEVADMLVERVIYERDRPILEEEEFVNLSDGELEVFMRKLMRTKFREWSYEREWRLLLLKSETRSTDFGGSGAQYVEVIDFCENFKLTGLYRGGLNVTTDEEIRESIPFGSAIEVSQVRLAFNSYGVVPNLASTKRVLKSY